MAYLLASFAASRPLQFAPSGVTISRGSGRAALPLARSGAARVSARSVGQTHFMEPIVTLPYSEWLVAEHLMKAFPSKQGYSMYAPLSRQEKGVDLLLTCRKNGVSRTATFQVKYSRAYQQKPSAKFSFAIWFQSFPVSERADFVVLAALYPNITGRGGGTKKSWWLPLLLMFRREEMIELFASLRTRSGNPERNFYFEFDTPKHVVLTRGSVEARDVTTFTMQARLPILREFFGAS